MTRDARLARIETFRMAWAGLTNETQKKEALKDCLNDLYRDDPDARTVLAAMTAGAETVLRGIPLADRSKTGRADTQFGTVIIEFKADLGKKAMAETAIWELKQYLASNRDAGGRSASRCSRRTGGRGATTRFRTRTRCDRVGSPRTWR